jgi:hypothetical protein
MSVSYKNIKYKTKLAEKLRVEMIRRTNGPK